MRVGPVTSRDLDDLVERSAEVSWEGGSTRLWIAAPPDLADTSPDGSGFLAAALPVAMRRGEDLQVDAPVSPRFLHRCESIQAAFCAWDPTLRRAEVTAAGEAIEAPGGTAAAGFFSRGVDSMFAATADQAEMGPLDCLVFADGLEPIHGEAVRAGELRLAGEAAAAIGLPLVSVSTNLRELTDPVLGDWEDLVGPGLAFIAHALAGGIGRALIPSTDSFKTLEPCGTGPVVDPLFSTERVQIVHGDVRLDRVEKVGWLASERPELLRYLKVCFFEDRTDNCGVCGKCLLTMAALMAAGALEAAEGFPEAIDIEAVERLRFSRVKSRIDWVNAARALDGNPAGAALGDAILAGLRRHALAAPPPASDGWVMPRSFRDHRLNLELSLVLDGRPYAPAVNGGPPARDGARRGLVPLVRGVDRGGERHVYGAGRAPAGELVGELGSLHSTWTADSVPLWLTSDGRILTPALPPATRSRRPRVAARWALAPLAWRRSAPLATRLAAARRRVRLLARTPLAGSPAGAELVGFLHRDAADGRLPLHAALHPVTGDQLLSTFWWESIDLGYGEPTLLGYLDARAPVTGRLGTTRPHLPWASRFGQRVRAQ